MKEQPLVAKTVTGQLAIALLHLFSYKRIAPKKCLLEEPVQCAPVKLAQGVE